MRRFALVIAICLCGLVQICASQETPSSAKSVLDAYVSAWNRHDFAAFDKVLAADAIHDDLGYGFHGQGAAQIKDFMRAVLKAEPDYDWRLTKIIVSGSDVAAEWTWTATYTGDSPSGPVVGQRIAGRGVAIVQIENGRIKRFTDYYDVASFFPKPAAKSAATGN
jgi:steroid delta-isomerase-like uncharacterized protein